MLQSTESLKDAALPGQRTSGRFTPAEAVPGDVGGPWHSGAACRRDEAGLFFAPSKEPTAARLAREEAAKRMCARCPVLLECREHALLQPDEELTPRFTTPSCAATPSWCIASGRCSATTGTSSVVINHSRNKVRTWSTRTSGSSRTCATC